MDVTQRENLLTQKPKVEQYRTIYKYSWYMPIVVQLILKVV